MSNAVSEEGSPFAMLSAAVSVVQGRGEKPAPVDIRSLVLGTRESSIQDRAKEEHRQQSKRGQAPKRVARRMDHGEKLLCAKNKEVAERDNVIVFCRFCHPSRVNRILGFCVRGPVGPACPQRGDFPAKLQFGPAAWGREMNGTLAEAAFVFDKEVRTSGRSFFEAAAR